MPQRHSSRWPNTQMALDTIPSSIEKCHEAESVWLSSYFQIRTQPELPGVVTGVFLSPTVVAGKVMGGPMLPLW